MGTPVRLDFTNVKQFEALEEGDYPCKVAVSTIEKAKSSGMPKLHLELEPQTEEGGGKFFIDLSLSERALWKVFDYLQAFGFSEEELRVPGGIEIDPEDLLGAEVIARIEKEEYEGKTRNRVKALLPIGS